MPTYEPPKKQGDHVFAKDLPRIFDDLTRRVAVDLGDCPEGRTLTSTFALCRTILSQPVYETTVDKGASIPGGDTHSVIYGARARTFKLAMIGYITAIKKRNRAQPSLGASRDVLDRFRRDIVLDDQFVRHAVLVVQMAVGEWVDSAFDAEAAAIIPGSAADLTSAHAGLQQVKSEVLKAARRH